MVSRGEASWPECGDGGWRASKRERERERAKKKKRRRTVKNDGRSGRKIDAHISCERVCKLRAAGTHPMLICPAGVGRPAEKPSCQLGDQVASGASRAEQKQRAREEEGERGAKAK